METFYILVNAGKPTIENSLCAIQGPTKIDINIPIVYSCTLKDKNKNLVKISDAQSIYKTTFKCGATRYYNSAANLSVVAAIASPSGLNFL